MTHHCSSAHLEGVGVEREGAQPREGEQRAQVLPAGGAGGAATPAARRWRRLHLRGSTERSRRVSAVRRRRPWRPERKGRWRPPPSWLLVLGGEGGSAAAAAAASAVISADADAAPSTRFLLRFLLLPLAPPPSRPPPVILLLLLLRSSCRARRHRSEPRALDVQALQSRRQRLEVDLLDLDPQVPQRALRLQRPEHEGEVCERRACQGVSIAREAIPGAVARKTSLKSTACCSVEGRRVTSRIPEEEEESERVDEDEEEERLEEEEEEEEEALALLFPSSRQLKLSPLHAAAASPALLASQAAERAVTGLRSTLGQASPSRRRSRKRRQESEAPRLREPQAPSPPRAPPVEEEEELAEEAAAAASLRRHLPLALLPGGPARGSGAARPGEGARRWWSPPRRGRGGRRAGRRGRSGRDRSPRRRRGESSLERKWRGRRRTRRRGGERLYLPRPLPGRAVFPSAHRILGAIAM